LPVRHPDETRRDHRPSPEDEHSIERLAVEPSRDHDSRQREERDRPEFGEDFRQAISLEQQAARDPHRVRRGEYFASPLRPDRHALEREHEARKQKRRQKGKLGKLDCLHLVCRHCRKRDPKREIAGDEQAQSDKEQRRRTPNRQLEEQVKQGNFRQDLFHRIFVFPIVLPPLRERPEDIPALAAHFAAQIVKQNNWKEITFSPEALQTLQAHSWPGNIRELRNVVERLLLFAEGDTVTPATVQAALPTQAGGDGSVTFSGTGTLAERVEQVERQMILEEIKRHNQNITNTAKALGLERSHLYKKCQQLGIDLRELRK